MKRDILVRGMSDTGAPQGLPGHLTLLPKLIFTLSGNDNNHRQPYLPPGKGLTIRSHTEILYRLLYSAHCAQSSYLRRAKSSSQAVTPRCASKPEIQIVLVRMTSSPSVLASLPNEIITNITKRLSIYDQLTMALTCHHFNSLILSSHAASRLNNMYPPYQPLDKEDIEEEWVRSNHGQFLMRLRSWMPDGLTLCRGCERRYIKIVFVMGGHRPRLKGCTICEENEKWALELMRFLQARKRHRRQKFMRSRHEIAGSMQSIWDSGFDGTGGAASGC